MENMAGSIEGQVTHPVGGGGSVQFPVRNFTELFSRGIGSGDIGRMMLVVVDAHGFFIQHGFKRVVGVRKGWQYIFAVGIADCGGILLFSHLVLWLYEWPCCPGLADCSQRRQ